MSETANGHIRLCDALQTPDTRGREIEQAMALALTSVVTRHPMRPADAVRGLIGNLIAVVQARSSPSEWQEVAAEVCAEIKRRLEPGNVASHRSGRA